MALLQAELATTICAHMSATASSSEECSGMMQPGLASIWSLSPCLLSPMLICRKSEYASFDPLFWLLHSAVDRCVWLFQSNNHDNDGGWAEPGERLSCQSTINTSGQYVEIRYDFTESGQQLGSHQTASQIQPPCVSFV